jgi:two-component system, chemotaxis family, chemotaxis protein CheY
MQQNLDYSKLSFLVVDDNVHMRRIIRSLLHSYGSRFVLEAEDGASGLESFTNNSPDVVITDWKMPIVDGIELTRLIRQGKANFRPSTPIIMLSGYAEKKIVIEASDAGVSDFLLKPISSKRLQHGIVTAVNNPRPFVAVDCFSLAINSAKSALHDERPMAASAHM